MNQSMNEIDLARRWLLAAGAGGAAAGLSGFSLPALGQAAAGDKPLPPIAAFKDATRMIVHSAHGIETRRSAFGTSGITSTDSLFLRNNLEPPDPSITQKADAWELKIDGVGEPRTLKVAELKRLGLTSVAVVLQCSGNGRGFFEHKASGSQWRVGAAGCTLWSGVPVADVVKALGGVSSGMRFMTSTGGETIPAGLDPKKVIVERSVPVHAMEGAILAWELNGDPIPLAHGGPLRLIIPGYYGVNNIKYVKHLAFTPEETDANIQRSGYRVREVGKKGDPSQPSMWEMNLKSFVTSPAGGESLPAGSTLIHGVAFTGGSPVKSVDVSVDGGKTWQPASFFGPNLGRYAWRQFVAKLSLPRGKHLVTSRATAEDGTVQPELRLENERGYANNAWRDHAVEVEVA